MGFRRYIHRYRVTVGPTQTQTHQELQEPKGAFILSFPKPKIGLLAARFSIYISSSFFEPVSVNYWRGTTRAICSLASMSAVQLKLCSRKSRANKWGKKMVNFPRRAHLFLHGSLASVRMYVRAVCVLHFSFHFFRTGVPSGLIKSCVLSISYALYANQSSGCVDKNAFQPFCTRVRSRQGSHLYVGIHFTQTPDSHFIPGFVALGSRFTKL